MSFANPTPIRVGMTGTLAGKRYRVAGRVVMGMEDAGETYYWNEFNLAGDDGGSATLVFEETERGGQWRLFTLFEPEYPMTAADAATKRVGDPLNLEGTDVRVTLVDESRVYRIEGAAPEGVEVGDVARYFNAEAGNKMLVVSWTGDEVEYYWGTDLSRGAVMNAFRLPAAPMAGSFLKASSTDKSSSMPGGMFKVVGFFLLAVVLFVGDSVFRPRLQRTAVVKTSAPAAPLPVGRVGRLESKTWHNVGHALVEIGQVGRIFDRHEYQLLDEDRNRAVLIYGLKPGDKQWFLFRPFQPVEPLSPRQAAALQTGQTVNFDGNATLVTELFQSVIRQAENSPPTDLKGEALEFGFSAQSGSAPLLVRWNDSGIAFHRGQLLAAKEIAEAFGAK